MLAELAAEGKRARCGTFFPSGAAWRMIGLVNIARPASVRSSMSLNAGLALLLALLSAPIAPAPARAAEAPSDAAGAIDVSVSARAFTLGEPVRIVARAPEPVSRMTGTIRGVPLDFVSMEGGDDASSAWAAWGVIDLDWPAGGVNVRAAATAADGSALTGMTTITVAKKSFPVSELKVESKYVEPPKDVQARIEREQAKLAAIYAVRRNVPPPAKPFVRPVSGEPTSVFGARRVFNGQKRKPHPGLDLRAATGTPVLCAGPGLVVLAEDLYFSGGTVIVDHGGGLFTVYAHLSRIDMKEGQSAAPGDAVGLSGATGRVTGPHLHWGGKLGAEIFDPTALLDPKLFE